MKFARATWLDDNGPIDRISIWVTEPCVETADDVAFLSGVVLGHLHIVLKHDRVPQALLRDRLALRAAEACVVAAGPTNGRESCATRSISCAPATCRDLPARSV